MKKRLLICREYSSIGLENIINSHVLLLQYPDTVLEQVSTSWIQTPNLAAVQLQRSYSLFPVLYSPTCKTTKPLYLAWPTQPSTSVARPGPSASPTCSNRYTGGLE